MAVLIEIIPLVFDILPAGDILAIVVVFVVVGVSMLLSVDKIKNDSIIEALKYDMV